MGKVRRPHNLAGECSTLSSLNRRGVTEVAPRRCLMAPVQLCLMIEGQEDVSWPQWLAVAGACERHGVPALFRSDHYMNLDLQHPERTALDAWGTICGLAAVTSTIELGTLVSPATFRHPSNLAKLVTTADQISGGRISLGLGAGWHDRVRVSANGKPYASCSRSSFRSCSGAGATSASRSPASTTR